MAGVVVMIVFLLTPTSYIRCESTREEMADSEKSSREKQKRKVRTVVGRGQESLLCYLGPDLRATTRI